MTDADSILILSACTGRKATNDSDVPLLAEDLYAGEQHRRLMRGVSGYRDAGEPAGPLELHIVSAGHGVVAGNERLRTYNATFSGMRHAQLRRRALRLGVPDAVSSLLAQPRKLAVLLLGADYLKAAQLGPTTVLGAPTIVFTSPGGARRLPESPRLHAIPLDNRDARHFSCGLVGLKGELAARLLARLTCMPQAWVPLERASLLQWLDNQQPLRSVRAGRDDLAKVA